MLKVKKNKQYILTYRCLSSSAALCFSALLLYWLGAGKQSGDVTALLSGSQPVQEESRAQRWRTDSGSQTLILFSSQFKEFLGTYNKLTENCFLDCVKDFTTREVKPEEVTCSEHCLQKYLKMTQRISMRFQEYHIQQNEALAAKAGLIGQPR
ncbi:unnamed protein product [Ranitomeya imitator]|uniref:Tim10-like domain-containing protein n=1 Tax=Ranitomeya imitator TaxID=111125 RepID=A0ABN9L5G8_9NEOB|nr:unnamed protein product [Ranitomeya imitator]